MGKSSKYFNSEKSANGYANRVGGEVRDVPKKGSFKVVYESKGQSQIPMHDNRQNDYREDFDFDGYTHTSDDV